MDPLIGDKFLGDNIGLGKRLLGGFQVAGVPIENVVVVFARTVGAFHLVLDVFAQQRRVIGHCLERVRKGRQVLVVDLDQFDRIGCRIPVLRDDGKPLPGFWKRTFSWASTA